MAIPQEYDFIAFGKTYKVKAYGGTVDSILAAVNKDFLWKLPEFIADPNGAWFPLPQVGAFKWVQGDYFN